MALDGVARPPGTALPPPRRWARRLGPLAFALALVAAAVVTLHHGPRGASHRTNGPTAHRPSPSAHRFSHTYPRDPVVPERPKVSGPDPVPRRATTISKHEVIRSFADLRAALPRHTLVRRGRRDWLLTRPIGLADRAALRLVGPGTLRLGPGAFVVARHGGTVDLRGIRVLGVDRRGRAQQRPVAGRGFLAATLGGHLRLEHDVLAHIGHLGKLTYGISFRRSGARSGIIHSTVVDAYFGVYMSLASGVQVVGDRFLHSVIYGIDPHTSSSRLVIRGNLVAGSGVHGIILAQGVHDCLVVDNVVRRAGLHGIVLFDHANRNVVTGNRVSETFDGIVVQDSSGNRVSRNSVAGARRAGIRVTGASTGNLFARNRLTGALVGAYVYAGPTRNRFLGTVFAADREFLRIRLDAPGNAVTPVPPRSELRSS
jgi:parallel beta-helix repeat protein